MNFFSRFPKWLLLLCAFTILAPVGGVLFAASGIYSVAADKGHWPITRWLLTLAMHRSVALHSNGVEPPAFPLDDPDFIRLGAAHYYGACAICHGALGMEPPAIPASMLPAPPDLAPAIAQFSDAELFWIVNHGLKYTGMPAWPAPGRDDEVWIVVAFLNAMPKMDVEEYRAFARALESMPITGSEKIHRGAEPDPITACARCHGDAQTPPPSTAVPRLSGQSAEYLATALRAYASGERPSGFMQPVAVALSGDDIEMLALYYSGLAQPQAPLEGVRDFAAIGEALAATGDLESGVPACNACHTAARLPTYPALAGQNALYIERQLRLWKSGGGRRSDEGAIMAPIAERMSEAQIAAAAAYYASLAPGGFREGEPP